MRVVVAAQQLRLDTTSEGICTAKFLTTIAGAGHEVVCLTADQVERTAGRPVCPWLPGVEVRHRDEFRSRGAWDRAARTATWLARRGRLGAWIDRKSGALQGYLTGYSSHVWREVDAWRAAIARLAEDVRPDVIVTRAAGTRFDPHAAMASLRLGIPWVANYHDPFPTSLYPPAYRLDVPFMSRAQERLHRRLIRRADALTFPSERLLRWILTDDLQAQRRKAFVVPHLACGAVGMDVDAGEPETDGAVFTVVHTGTLLHQRNPQPLLAAFLTFVREERIRRGTARLVFIGRVHRDHLALPEWNALEELGAVERLEDRVPYRVAMDSARRAAAVVVLEADDEESPFFPAKLADYLWLRRPVLALSPRESTAADVLGPDYRLRVAPADTAAIAASLRALWRAWSDGRLADFLPRQEALASCAPPAVRAEFDRVLAFACRGQASARRMAAPPGTDPLPYEHTEDTGRPARTVVGAS